MPRMAWRSAISYSCCHSSAVGTRERVSRVPNDTCMREKNNCCIEKLNRTAGMVNWLIAFATNEEVDDDMHQNEEDDIDDEYLRL